MTTNENPGGDRGPQGSAAVTPNLSDVPVLPQHFPLYAVLSHNGNVLIVLGWVDGKPLVQLLDREATTGPRVCEWPYKLHTDHDDALSDRDLIRRKIRQARERAAWGELPHPMDDFWAKQAPINAAKYQAIRARLKSEAGA